LRCQYNIQRREDSMLIFYIIDSTSYPKGGSLMITEKKRAED